MSQKVRWNNKHATAFLALTAIVAVSAPVVAHAAGLAVPDLGDLIPATFKSLSSAVNVIWNTVVGVAGLAFLGYLLYGGFMFLTSSGDEALATKARHTLRDAVIGIALVVFAWPIGQLVLTILGQQGIIKDNPGLNAPTATSSAPFNSVSSNGSNTTGANTTPPTNTNANGTNTTGANNIAPTSGTQTTGTATSVQPDTSFTLTQPGQSTQTVPVDQNGQASYTLSPGNYADTELSFVSSQTGGAVGNLIININRKASGANTNSYLAMYGSVQISQNGNITLKLPVGEMIRVTNTNTGVEYLKDQVISSGTNGANQQIRILVP